MNRIFIFMAATLMAVGCSGEYQKVATYEELPSPQPLSEEAQQAWESVEDGLRGSWADCDLRYLRDEVPSRDLKDVCKLVGWRGERLSAQILLWAREGVDGVECKVSDLKSSEALLPSEIVKTRFVRYTIADEQTFSYKKSGNTFSAADMLDSLSRFDMEARTVRPVWVTFNIPHDAKAGVYKGKITISHQGF
jgi:hypothetical protein